MSSNGIFAGIQMIHQLHHLAYLPIYALLVGSIFELP